jgi:hypothetical protein
MSSGLRDGHGRTGAGGGPAGGGYGAGSQRGCLRPPLGIHPWLALAYLRWIVPPLAGLVAWSRADWTLAAYLPRTIEAGPSVPDVAQAMERVGLQVVQPKSLFAQIVWLIVAVKPVLGIPQELSP